MTKKKILFLVQIPPPIHGASIVNQIIYESSLINSQFDCYFVNISTAKIISNIGQFSLSKTYNSLKLLIVCVLKYFRIRPNLVYITLSPFGPAFYRDAVITILLKYLGAKIAFHLHGKGISTEINSSGIKRELYRFVFNKVSIIHLSENLYYDIIDVYDKSMPLFSVPNGVDEVHCKEIRPTDKISFIYLSNLIRPKGVDILVKAATIIPDEFQNLFEVKIIGKDSDENLNKELVDIITKHKYKNIRILGAKYGTDKVKELCDSHVLVFPTKYRNECFPLVILEAMSAGLAVVSTREGAIPDIVRNNDSGLLLDKRTPLELANIMTNFIKNPNLAIKMGSVGREIFENKYRKEIFEQNLATVLTKLTEI